MESVSIHRLGWLPKRQLTAMREAQQEAAREWMDLVAIHKAARASGGKWPNRDFLQKLTKGQYRLHSQTIQMIVHQLLTNVQATTERRRNDPSSRTWLRYPHREKTFYPLYWPAQAVEYQKDAKRLILPMGRGRKSLVFKLGITFEPGSVKLVWKDGYELHVVRADVEKAKEPPGDQMACGDLGEIHQVAVVTDTGTALVVSGRGIRSHKRLLSKQLGEIAQKRSRCKRGSKRWKRLQRVRCLQSQRAKRRIRDQRHKGTRKAIDFCVAQKVGTLFLGDPRGVRDLKAGRHHNQRIARWEVGKDIGYLRHKAEKASIVCSIGDERGTSSRCPQCGHRHRPKGRNWQCRACGFTGHRDLVGAANMHQNAFGVKVTFPAQVTYRRAGPMRAVRGVKSLALSSPERRRSPDAGLGLQPQMLGTAPPQGGTSGPPRDTGLPVRRKTLPKAA